MNKLFLIFMLMIIFIVNCNTKDKYPFDNIDWPRFRGPNADSISIEKDWDLKAIGKNKERIKPLWIQQIGLGYSSVSIKGDFIYTMGFNNKNITENIICMEIKSGKIKWQYNFSSKRYLNEGSRSTPTLEGKCLYAVGCDGKIICLNAITGKLLWKKDLINDFNAKEPIWGFAGSPVIEGDLLLINANKSGVALNKNTGETIWASTPGICGYSTPVIFTYNKSKYTAIFGQNKLYIVEVSNGTILTSYDWNTKYDINAADPIITGNKIFISSNYGKGSECLELSGNKLKKLWASNMHNHFITSINIDNCVYGVDENYIQQDGHIIQANYFKCIDYDTGKNLWEDKIEKFGSFIVADKNKMIGLTIKGKLIIAELSKSGLKKISEGKLSNGFYYTSPVLCRGMIFVRNYSGDLFCIDVR